MFFYSKKKCCCNVGHLVGGDVTILHPNITEFHKDQIHYEYTCYRCSAVVRDWDYSGNFGPVADAVIRLLYLKALYPKN